MRSLLLVLVILLLVLGIGHNFPNATAAAAGSTDSLASPFFPSGESSSSDVLNDIAEALKKLDELEQALIQANKGKLPTFGTPLGTLAERIDKISGALDKQTPIAPPGQTPKPPIHHPGSAIDELTTHLQDLRTQQLNQKQIRERLIVDQQHLKLREIAAARLSEALEKLSANPIVLPELRPQFDALALDSDHLHLAISGCLTSLARMQKSIDSQLSILAINIANLQANLNDPHLRSIISAIDQSNASVSNQVSSSIQTSKAELANRDRVTAINVQQAVHHPAPANSQPSNRPSTGMPAIPIGTIPSEDCPPGFKNIGGQCVKLGMYPH